MLRNVINLSKYTSKQKIMKSRKILMEINRSIKSEIPNEIILKRVCTILNRNISRFDWVGFYRVSENIDDTLELTTYVGESTEHTIIPFGKGVCGQVAEELETKTVQDTRKESNYLACSIHVRSEIVIPIFSNGKLVAVLDVDSHKPGAFTQEYRFLLEESARKVATIF